MLDDIKKTADAKMQKSLESLKNDLAKVRTGRAHAGLLDHVMVEYYGSMVAVNQVANVNLGDFCILASAIFFISSNIFAPTFTLF